MLTENDARSRFADYFLALVESGERAAADAPTEWETFVAVGIVSGDLPPGADAWKAPRMLTGYVRGGGTALGISAALEPADGELERRTLTLNAETISTLRALGGGDLSAGAQRAAELIRTRWRAPAN